jgi:hypothetical protein
MGQRSHSIWALEAHVFLLTFFSSLVLSPYPFQFPTSALRSPQKWQRHPAEPNTPHTPPPAAALSHGRRNGHGCCRLRVPPLRLRHPPIPLGQARPAARRRGRACDTVRDEREAEEAAARGARAPRGALHVRGRRALRPGTVPLSFLS